MFFIRLTRLIYTPKTRLFYPIKKDFFILFYFSSINYGKCIEEKERGNLNIYDQFFIGTEKGPENLYGNDRLKMHLYSREKMHFNFCLLRDLLQCSLDLVILIYPMLSASTYS